MNHSRYIIIWKKHSIYDSAYSINKKKATKKSKQNNPSTVIAFKVILVQF